MDRRPCWGSWSSRVEGRTQASGRGEEWPYCCHSRSSCSAVNQREDQTESEMSKPSEQESQLVVMEGNGDRVFAPLEVQ